MTKSLPSESSPKESRPLSESTEFENDIRRERQMDGIAKAKELGVKFGRERELTPEKVAEIKGLREAGDHCA